VDIHEIRTAFASEACAAPSLFADLAKVELYIAESYRSRAFIELLQNADDAGACRFLIHQVGTTLLVANDGRKFSAEDVTALCRSGASNKRRGRGTIGYRGIGFKSVAGVAREIDVISGASSFRFSKELTQKLLKIDTDVPLIRIPHPITTEEHRSVTLAESLLSEGMNTVFVLFGLNERMVAEEAASFDETAMLFLSNVSQVEIDLVGVKRKLNRVATLRDDGFSVEKFGSSDAPHEWLVVGANGDCEKVAFAFDGEAVIPASPHQSVIHAFMPTTEFAGALLKMNGDFSTDPSRKSVDMDEASARAFEQCALRLARVLKQAVASGGLPGIFSPFLLATPVEGRFRKLLRDSLLRLLEDIRVEVSGVSAKPVEIRLRPEWLSYADYEFLGKGTAHVPQELLVNHPELPDFLKWMGASYLSLEESLELMRQFPPSATGCGQILCRAARQYRYDLTEPRLDLLANSPLLPVAGCSVTPRNYRDEPLLPEFLEFLEQQPEGDDLKYLSRRLKLPDSLFGLTTSSATIRNQSQHQNKPDNSPRMPNVPSSLFKALPAIKAWRSAEQNALAWFTARINVISAKDVSQSNVGYDLEIVMRNGGRLHVEVKSVSRFGDAIRLTNNEHATAYQLGASYLLAIVVNAGDQFEICFIRDPVRTLALEKRCEQWSWHSADYLDHISDSVE
jgi:hypothetical protein